MVLRGDKSADYAETVALLSALETCAVAENWNNLIACLGALSSFWSGAIEWEKTRLVSQIAGQPLEQTEGRLTLTKRLVAIVAPNIERIRSMVLAGGREQSFVLCLARRSFTLRQFTTGCGRGFTSGGEGP